MGIFSQLVPQWVYRPGQAAQSLPWAKPAEHHSLWLTTFFPHLGQQPQCSLKCRFVLLALKTSWSSPKALLSLAFPFRLSVFFPSLRIKNSSIFPLTTTLLAILPWVKGARGRSGAPTFPFLGFLCLFSPNSFLGGTWQLSPSCQGSYSPC